MSLQARITRDDVSTVFSKLDVALHRLGPILEAVGLEVVSLAQRAFTDSSLRVAQWARQSDGSAATLIQSGVLRQSIRITNLSGSAVTIGSDRVYAAIHQLGGTIEAKSGRKLKFIVGRVTDFVSKVTIPARPFFPIDKSGNLRSRSAGSVRSWKKRSRSTCLD